MASDRIDLLGLGVAASQGAEILGDRVRCARSWSHMDLEPVRLAPGWWRLSLERDEGGDLTLDLWGEETGDWASLTLRPGQSRIFRTAGGAQSVRLWPQEGAGERRLPGLRLERLGPAGRLGLFAARVLRLIASGDPKRIARALGAARRRDQPLALRPVGQTAAGHDASISSPEAPDFSFRVDVVGDDAEGRARTLASLERQTLKAWSLGAAPADAALRLAAGDVLRPDALAALAAELQRRPEVIALYADEVIDGVETAKPEWDVDLAQQVAYSGRLTAFRGPAPAPADGHQALLELDRQGQGAAIGRLALPLLSRSGSPPDRLDLRPPAPTALPPVSVIIPTRDRPELLRVVLEGVLDRTDYPDLELIIVDNGTQDVEALRLMDARRDDPRVRILRDDGPFNFSRLNNRAVAMASGEVLALVNNDIEVVDGGWLKTLVGEALRSGVGAVGPLLLFPDRTIQHAGVALGVGGVAGHPWRGLPESAVAGHAHLAFVQRRSAVTAACLVVRKAAYLAAGGMDEARYPVTLNDVDLCLKLDAAGMRNLYTPHARLIHHESQSRPSDRAPEQRRRTLAEQTAFRAAWGDRIADDPWYSPRLTRQDETGRPRG